MPVNFLPPKLPNVPRPASSDPAEVEQLLWRGFKGDLAFDVGANLGQSLWWMVERFKKIISLEPAHESFRMMKDDWGGRQDVILLMQAVSDHEGDIQTSMREWQISGGQLVADHMPYKRYIHGITSPTESLPWGREIGTRTVPCTTIDKLATIYGTPDFIKCDVEGHEAQVVSGASAVLAEGKTDWLIEFHVRNNFDICLKLLSDAGYGPEIIRHPHYQQGSELWYAHGWIRAEAPNR